MICYPKFILFIFQTVVYGSQSISVFAGMNTNADGQGTNARFQQPTSVTADSNGNLYIADFSSCKIRKINSTRYASSIAGTGCALLEGQGLFASFNAPNDVAIDSFGNLFIADTNNNMIRKINTTGYVSTFAGSWTASNQDGQGTLASFNQPTSIFINGSTNYMYVVDAGNNQIRGITPTGYVTTLYDSSYFTNPERIIADKSGNLYVTDVGQNVVWKISSSGSVRVFAGSSSAGYADGRGTSASFKHPSGIGIDSSNNLYVADRDNNYIRKITSSGRVTTFAGNGSPGYLDGQGKAASFNSFDGLTVDHYGNIIVADFNNMVVRMVNSSGYVSTLAGSNYPTLQDGQGVNAIFSYIGGLALDNSGNVYATDERNQVVRKIDNTGYVTTLGYSYQSPYFVAVDNQGNVYVSDFNANQILCNNQILAGSSSGKSGYNDGQGTSALFNGPAGIAIDNSGNVIVSDMGNNLIRQISSSGNVVTIAGNQQASLVDGQGTSASFYHPAGIAIDNSSNIYIVDSWNSAIRKIDATGYVATIAGNGYTNFVDGQGTMAGFSYPYGISLDSYGNIFVADTYNNAVRMINSEGYVTTIGSVNSPTDIKIDSSGNIFVADGQDSVIYVMKGYVGITTSTIPASSTTSSTSTVLITSPTSSLTFTSLTTSPTSTVLITSPTSYLTSTSLSTSPTSTVLITSTTSYLTSTSLSTSPTSTVLITSTTSSYVTTTLATSMASTTSTNSIKLSTSIAPNTSTTFINSLISPLLPFTTISPSNGITTTFVATLLYQSATSSICNLSFTPASTANQTNSPLTTNLIVSPKTFTTTHFSSSTTLKLSASIVTPLTSPTTTVTNQNLEAGVFGLPTSVIIYVVIAFVGFVAIWILAICVVLFRRRTTVPFRTPRLFELRKYNSRTGLLNR